MPRQSRTGALRHPLTIILGIVAHVRTLRALVRHGGAMSASMLVRQTSLAKASVRLALVSLQAMGVIEEAGDARTKLYKFAARHPLAQSIAALFEAEQARFDSIMKAISRAAGMNANITAVWLYGSAARNEDDESSDVDIVVVTIDGNGPDAEQFFRLNLQHDENGLFFRASVVALEASDVRRLAGASDPWWVSLVADAITLKGDRPDVLANRFVKAEKPLRKKAR